MTFWRGLHPGRHFTAAMGWAVFGVVTLAALVTANLAASWAERQAKEDAQDQLMELATQVRDAVSMNLEARRSLLQATAAQIAASGDHSPSALLRTLAAVRIQFPELSWLGVADASGHWRVGTAGIEVGADVSGQTWFKQGLSQALVSQASVSNLPGSAALIVAAPLAPGEVAPSALVAGQVAWPWVDELVARMHSALNPSRQIELMLADRDGWVLVGPPAWRATQLRDGRDLTEGGVYVMGQRAQLLLARDLGLGWTLVVRQPANIALAAARSTGRTAFLTVFMTGLLAAAAAALVTQLLMRRLTALALQADAVRRGTQQSLVVPPGVDEISRIGATLAEAVNHLQTEKLALQNLNAELDQRVAERTARIERLGEEARHAAVTRERLRIARDLHDTLAHSLMALLTQIRLVRKLRLRLAPDELEAELDRAEAVAATGLAEARGAIAQIRGSDVRDAGLGSALQELARRLRERSGLQVHLQLAPQAQNLADERAETVFRIVEEALRNVERHAQARAVQVRLTWLAHGPDDASQVTVEVADDGQGFDLALRRPGHFGLRGMQEQAALMASQLEVQSRAGEGTQVRLTFMV